MFQLHFPTVDCSLEGTEFADVDVAIAEGRRGGFSFSIWQAGVGLVYTWCPIAGAKHYGFAR